MDSIWNTDPGNASMSEAQQRRIFVGLALLSTVFQAVILLYLRRQPDFDVRAVPASVSLGLSVLMSALVLWPSIPLRVIQRVVVGLICGWFLVNLSSVVTTARPITSGLLIHMVILALCSFTWLPPRVAAALMSVVLILLLGAASVSRAPDLPGVILVGLTVPLVWYLTVHGREVSRERVRNEVLRTLAYRDPLTGVHNRRSGAEALSALLDRPASGTDQPSAARPTPERPAPEVAPEVVVALFDLDHFKRINDSLGHQHGDRVLVAVAQALQATLRPTDVVVRWGGEEFLAILNGLTRAQARERVGAALAAVRTLRLEGLPPITISAGIAYASETTDQDALLDLADGRLYQAKAAGRDRAH